MKSKILVTDSSAAVCRLYNYYLEPLQCEITTSINAGECIDLAISIEPDIITLGMELDGASGVELCAQLKENSETALIPVVIISSASDHETKVKAFEAGAIEYIIKPCSPEFLRSRIESILKSRRHASAQDKPSAEDSPNVLVAEDSRSILSVYEYLLGQMGCNFIPCEDGLIAWNKLHEVAATVDLIISDIHMPNMDGKEFTRRVRESNKFDQIPLLISSTVNDIDEIKSLLTLGANDYVTKPFSHEEFAARISAHLRTRSLMKEQKRLNHELSNMNEILEERVAQRTQELREANIDTIYMLALASDAKDTDTGNHIQRVRFYSESLATKMGFSSTEADEIGYSSMMHDIGKIAIPDNILKKPGKLTTDEVTVMRTHAYEGAKILGDREFYQKARDIAHCHHERFDGKGYPRGLISEDIPISARIVAVADIYDALSSKRAYKKAWTQEEVLLELINIADSHLDPKCVNAFLELVHNGTVDDIRKRFPDAASLAAKKAG